jgi:rSAM/selenodomain-associated transferase 1
LHALAAALSLANMPADAAVVILARYPRAGTVKTRLARDIGDHAASAVYRAFLHDLREGLRDDPEWDLWWAYDPPGSRFVPDVVPGARAFPQPPGHLGERMRAAFEAAFERGYRTVVVVGSDLPHLTRERVREACRYDSQRITIGPAEDGGYYLIAGAMVPPVFDSIAWGRDDVLDRTLTRLRSAGCAVRLLPADYDVDDVRDLRRLAADLANGVRPDLPHTRAALALVDGIGP